MFITFHFLAVFIQEFACSLFPLKKCKHEGMALFFKAFNFACFNRVSELEVCALPVTFIMVALHQKNFQIVFEFSSCMIEML